MTTWMWILIVAIAALAIAGYYWRGALRTWMPTRSTRRHRPRNQGRDAPIGQSLFAHLRPLDRLWLAAVTVAYIFILFALSFILPTSLFGKVLGAMIGFVVFTFIMPWIPGAIDSFINRPNRRRPEGAGQEILARDYPKSSFGFFTYVQPGRVKMIERGEKFVRAVMAYDGHMFFGERTDNTLTPEHANYWEVVATEDPYADTHPIPFPTRKHGKRWWLYAPLSILFWAWKRWVYKVTGAVFTGIPPYQTVRTYPMEHFRRITHGTGSVELRRIEDYSDHYRVADFQFPVVVSDADTQDKIPVRVMLNEIGRVYNPYLTAFETDDDWPTRFIASVSNSVTLFTRARPLNTVLTAQNTEQAKELARTVTTSSGTSVKKFGIKIRESQVLDISPTDPTIRTRLGDVALAQVDKDAALLRADALAAPVIAVGKALKDYPEAVVVVQTEAMVKAAEAASKNGNLVLMGGNHLDTGQAALLQQLRRLTPPTQTPNNGGNP